MRMDSLETVARRWSKAIRGDGSSCITDDESAPAAGLVRETQLMRQQEPGRGGERAKQFLQAGADLSEVAAHAGFWDQSQFCRHFKRLMGVTPGWFRMHTRIS
jgi:AraC-like DNA-binding protein